MATMTISLPDPIKDWIETQIEEGGYASAGDYLSDLVRRDRAQRDHPDLTLDNVRRLVEESRASGVSSKSVSDILAEARTKARHNRLVNE